ncbi:MAG: hypothetical protein CMI02_19155 [Oceanospirillaceae bacterium]|nr:hypothetical protein [Oceanospirillaceae bacterium]MBT14147.1 hypothetical protein [Oceanospirillaceae bacterium]|tara:strand:- start:40950 stop:41315 length:366 start_codon:yes stop_codon:yes gene_type:complete
MIKMHRQKGMSFTSVISLIALLVVLIKTGYELVPMYLDDQVLNGVLERMKDSGEVTHESSPRHVKSMLEKRLDMNNIQLAYDELSIKKNGNSLVLDWPYEKRSNWFGNVDLVVSFHQHVEF